MFGAGVLEAYGLACGSDDADRTFGAAGDA